MLRWVALGLFAGSPLLLDAALRGPRWSLFGAAASVALWGGLALALRSPPSRAALALASGAILALQLAFFRGYHVFIDRDAALAARRMWSDVVPVLRAHLPLLLGLGAAFALAHYACLRLVPTDRARPGRWAALAGVLLLPWLARTPDASALRAASVLLETREARATGNVQLPALRSTKGRLPHVLFVLTESVRASDYSPATAPETAALFGARVPLRQLRSLGSYSAIAVNALLGGRVPLGSRAELAATPLVFDYARAVRADETRPGVHYWAAHVDSLFERSDVRSATDSFVVLEDLVGKKVENLEQVLDRQPDLLLAALAETRLRDAEGPLFVLLHLSGTHAPYWVDAGHSPFQPSRHAASWSGLAELHNAYKNAIRTQDAHLARVVRAFLARAGSEPWLVVFTSDHGEAFGEHKAIHHGQNVYDEQIHVPGFIAWGNGALSDEQVRALEAHQHDPLTHLDLLPTLLDAWGVLDSFALTQERSRLQGQSLLRPFSAPRPPLPLTNCTELFPCPLKNWGVLGAEHALVAQVWDAGFRCSELRSGREGLALDEPACAELLSASRRLWPRLPNGAPNR